ncbi:MAG: DegV family protein [Anaerolineae bacterium]|nr:DegV family protein [Anaerolineae bacterium]
MGETNPERVVVVTDSTSDIPKDVVERLGIYVVPQILIMGDQTWLDGVDIDPSTFYELLRISPHFPSTSQASVGYFEDLFSRLAEQYAGIAAILVSAGVSGTVNSATTAAANLPHLAVEIVDSRSASMQLGLIAIEAARAAVAGASLEEVVATARSLIDRVRVYFVVDTLEYLHRGGRIGAAARLLGTALNLKPVLEMRGGIVQPVAKIRTRRKALERVFDLVEAGVAGAACVHMAVLHVAVPDEAARLAEQLAERFEPVELIRSEAGPVVGAHVGPGAVGVAFYAEKD